MGNSFKYSFFYIYFVGKFVSICEKTVFSEFVRNGIAYVTVSTSFMSSY